MNRTNKLLIAVLALIASLCLILCSCNGEGPTPSGEPEWVDYVSGLKLDMSTDSLKIEATVKSYIDGDTTHFYVDRSVCEDG